MDIYSKMSYVHCAVLTAFIHLLGLYLDGSFVEGLHLAYPKTEALLGAIPFIKYKIGDQSTSSDPNNRNGMSWCLASAYLLGLPLREYDVLQLLKPF